jgi:predicted RNA-binding protein with TRAM domain
VVCGLQRGVEEGEPNELKARTAASDGQGDVKIAEP